MNCFITNTLLQEAINKTRSKRKTQTKLLEDEFERLLNVGTNIYSKKHKENSIMDINTNLYKTKSFKNSIMNIGADVYKSKKKFRVINEANKKIGLARSDAKRNSPNIQFDMTKIKNSDYFFNELAKVFPELLDVIELDKDKWIIYYNYDTSWKARSLDAVYEKLLINQIENELEDANYEYEFDEHDYYFYME